MRKSNAATHLMSYSSEYVSWKSMKLRCLNEKATGYSRYGGAGIGICDRWMSFENFYADMGVRPKGSTLDRIDNTKGYCPENCRWSTKKDQCNNRNNNVRLEYQGEVKTVAQWARSIGVKHSTLKNRLRLGWSVDRALGVKVRGDIDQAIEGVLGLVQSGIPIKRACLQFNVCKSTYYNRLKALQKMSK